MIDNSKSGKSLLTSIEGEVVEKNKVGRPPKYTALEIAEIHRDLSDYIERTADPTVVGFVAFYRKHYVNKQYICSRPEFSDLVKLAIEKQEAYLVAGATSNRLNATFAIFRLKQPQHGWSDKQEQDIKVEQVQPIIGGMAKKQIESDVHTDDDD